MRRKTRQQTSPREGKIRKIFSVFAFQFIIGVNQSAIGDIRICITKYGKLNPKTNEKEKSDPRRELLAFAETEAREMLEKWQ